MGTKEISTITGDELEKMLQEARYKLNLLEEEKRIRNEKAKKVAWSELIDDIKEFCSKYGPITVSGCNRWDTFSIVVNSENINDSLIGTIDTKIIT